MLLYVEFRWCFEVTSQKSGSKNQVVCDCLSEMKRPSRKPLAGGDFVVKYIGRIGRYSCQISGSKDQVARGPPSVRDGAFEDAFDFEGVGH